MKNDDIQKAFLGLSIPSGIPKAEVNLSAVLQGPTPVVKVDPKPKQGPFRAILKGVIKVHSEPKLLKAVATFEKNNFKKDPATTIDEIVARWFGTETVVESTLDGADIILDHSVEIKPLFSPFLVNLAKGASGEILYHGQDGHKTIYTLADGKLSARTPE